MSIIRGPRPETKFYTLDKSISEDLRLSWAARGLLIFLLGKPDHWEVSVRHLINQTKDALGKSSGRDAVRVILKELEAAGYLTVDRARNDTGVFNGMAYTVCEQPISVAPGAENPFVESPQTDNPGPANPAPDKPSPENPPLVSNELQQAIEVAPNLEEAASAQAPVADAPETPKKEKVSKKFDALSAKPSNVSAESWSDWCQHRREIRKPLTAKTCEQQAKALEAHQTPDAVINLSISNGWTGLFPEKVLPTTKGTPSRHNGFADRNYEAGLTAREGGGYAF